MHRCLKIVFVALFALSQVMASYRVAIADARSEWRPADSGTALQLAQAQQPAQYERGAYGRGASGAGSVDVEPPLIEHDVVPEAEADIRQTFVATVVDDQDLDSVQFYYRYAGESSFSRNVMTPVSFTSTYIAQIPTDPNSLKAIEYYIQARDASGNRTVRGYTFSPLVRNIVPAFVAEPVAQSVPDTTPAVDETATESRFPRAVYVIGGVLLLGLIASAAGSSGSGSEGGGACTDAGCRLSLTIDQPF